MSSKRRLVKAIKILSRSFSKFSKKYLTAINKPINWLLRTLFITRRRRESANAGFVLPTVAMVALVVVLLTTAILFRSFERSQNASNVRVNQAVLNAATPALNRAKAKIEQLFNDPTLPRSTPSDTTLYNAFKNNIEKYTFGDEESLQVQYDIDGNKKISTTDDLNLEDREAVITAWKFPVDTDNNGKYDSYTLYGVFFRSPSRGNDGKFDRSRNALDARTPPMDDGTLGGICAASKGTSASLVGESGWYKSGATIKKSFFVYSTTVPITTAPTDANKFEQYKGNKGFSALEYQQDQERIPIINNAVVYEDDLEITPGSGLNINGSLFTNSNLLTAKTYNDIRFYQVSSPKSCFYQAQNSKITVGGNVGNGRISGEGEGSSVQVDLFKPGAEGAKKTIDKTNKSANNTAGDIAYNTKAYAERINLLVETQSKQTSTNDPKEVQDNIKARIKENAGLDAAEVRRQELEAYFKKRTRRVPFAEVKLTDTAPTTVTLGGSGDKLRPPDEWINPTNTNTKLTLDPTKLPATEPNKLKETYKEEEKLVGDRIYAGNNLPALWYDSSKDDFFGKKTPQDVTPKTEWDDWKPNDKYKYRTRFTNVQDLISLSGTTDRDGYFEIKAAEKPKNVLDNVGGMRVVTGAGIYVDGDILEKANASYRWDEDLGSGKFRTSLKLHPTTLDTNFVDPNSTDLNKIKFNDLKFNDKGTPKNPIVVYPDSMPMAGGTGQPADKGDLQMRASAVYFYTDNSGKDNSKKDQVPIACVSSYYDPTNAVTAQNQTSLPVQAKNPDADPATLLGKSNNGVVYAAPYTSYSERLTAVGTYSKQLRQQARLVFPDGRLVNEPLRNALTQFDTDTSKLSMADNSAIDAAICAVQILGGATPNGSPLVPHRAIYETAFLDARQIKSIEQQANVFNLPNQDYTRSIEQRQPLEVRVTVLDLDKLRKVAIGNDGKKGTTESKQEYLLPNSGIIYATRDDALRDLSDQPGNSIDKRKLISPTDYKLDPTRRPNGIMLVKGENLVRESQYRDVEKGLILATNVSAYVKGDFNLHSKGGDKTKPVEEFVEQLRNNKGEIDWSKFYGRKTLDDDFACRKNDPRLPNNKCTTGDSWRPATILADAVTILSDNFRFGFRDEGDYDLRNNQGNVVVPNYDFNGNGVKTDTLDETVLKVDLNGDGDMTDIAVKEADQISSIAVLRQQGFFDNNFLTSSSWINDSGTNKGYPKDDFDPNTPGNQPSSSYVNNFVTPIQRRVKFNEYLMEICPKVPVSTCTASDWSVDGGGKKATDEVGQDYKIAIHKAGTTVDLADLSLRPYARRVAFARKPDGSLVLDEKGHPVPLGVDSSSPAKIEAFPNYKATITVKGTDKSYPGSATLPRTRPNTDPLALWYRTTKRDLLLDKKLPTDTNYGYKYPLFYQTMDGQPLKGTDPNEQPLLVPVLQIHMPYDEWTKSGNDPGDDRDNLPEPKNRGIATDKNWLQIANATTSNLVIAGGDTPGRPTESNGGLENFVRYLENWKDSSNISGSLIQYKRSIYATAPWQAVQLDTSKNPKAPTTLFGNDYPQYYRINSTTIGDDDNNKGNGMSPFYKAPSRQWGFDVGLLSQLPDLFAQQFTIPPTTKPNEFFREVSRDDSWVQALLCAKNQDGKTNAVPNSERPKDFCDKHTDFN